MSFVTEFTVLSSRRKISSTYHKFVFGVLPLFSTTKSDNDYCIAAQHLALGGSHSACHDFGTVVR